MAKKDSKSGDNSVSGCVLPVLVSSRVGIHTFCALFVWERSTLSQLSRGLTVCTVSSSHCGRSAPGELSLRREPSPAFLVAQAPLLPRLSGGCGRGDCKWIWWREWRWACPFLLPHPPGPALPARVRKPAPRFLPPEERARQIRLSSSEEVDVESIDETVDSPPHFPQYEYECVPIAFRRSISFPRGTMVTCLT